MSQTEREDWQRYGAEVRQLAAAFGMTDYCHQNTIDLPLISDPLDVTWSSLQRLP